MATYTYQVDHGDESPRVYAGMVLNGGKATAVEFGSALDRLAKLEEAVTDLSNWYGENIPGTDRPPGLDEMRKIINEQQR